MTTLEERVLETIVATGLDEVVADLAHKVGVSKQTIYKWKKGEWVKHMKAENLVSLAELAGYETSWILKGKGPKKKSLTSDQEKILQLSEIMGKDARENWIANGVFLTSVNPTDKAVEKPQAQPIQSIKTESLKTAPRRLRDERRQRELTVKKELRKLPWTYECKR